LGFPTFKGKGAKPPEFKQRGREREEKRGLLQKPFVL
jgi:hypothetical protein